MEIIGYSHIDLNLSLSWLINDIIDLNIMLIRMWSIGNTPQFTR